MIEQPCMIDETPEEHPFALPDQALVKVERAMKSAVTEFKRLQTTTRDDARRVELLIAAETCRDQLDLIRLANRA